jgi:lipoprotein-releasing system permease protein
MGVTALIVVMGVMGGLQKGYIDSILEISSFHLRVEIPAHSAAKAAEAIRGVMGVSSVAVFKETHMLALGPFEQTLTLLLRAFPEGSQHEDSGLVRSLGLQTSGSFPEKGNLILGEEAAKMLGASKGTTIKLFGIAQQPDGEGIVPVSAEIPLGTPFSSGYYEFDSSMGFVALSDGDALSDAFPSPKLTLGIKLDDRYQDYRIAPKIAALVPDGSGPLVSWRVFNRSFFSALRTEKSVMMILISLIFVVVAINIFHAMRRTIAAKIGDIALLKAVGASNSDIRRIFAIEGFFVGTLGAIAGGLLGLVLVGNINAILDGIAFTLRQIAEVLQRLGLQIGNKDFKLFSPA